MKINFIVSFLISLLFFANLHADDAHVAPITAKMPEIKNMILNDLLISTIKSSNESRGNPSQEEIDAMENTWKAELDSENYDLIASVVETSLSDHLRAVIDKSDGLITEINVMDAKGFSVGQTSPNSDIWQGEEIKYTKTFLVGPDALFVDEVEEDGSTQSFQSQSNFTVADPATGEAIGAVSVGIDVGMVMD